MVKLKQQEDFTWKVPAPAGLWVVAPDRHHAPDDDPEGGVDPKAFSCLLQGIEIAKPNGFIDLGDIGEWSSVSPWKFKRRSRPSVKEVEVDLQRDLDAVHAGQDKIDGALAAAGCKKKIQLEGNHELWVQYMAEEWKDKLGKALRSDLRDPSKAVPNLLQLKERDYAFVPYGDYIRLGQLYLYHGGHINSYKYHAAYHLRDLSASVMYGHYHDYQVAKTGLLGKGLHAAWSIGFLGKPRKPFMRGKPTNWSHNFALVHVEKDGTFHVEVIEIFNGKCYIWGHKVTG